MRRADEQHRLLATDVETAIDLALGAIYFRHLISHDSLDTAFVTAVVASVIAEGDTSTLTDTSSDRRRAGVASVTGGRPG